MEKDQTQTIRIDKKKHHILSFFCKFKGKTIKEYVEDKMDKDPDLKKFKSRIEDLMFKYDEEE